MVEDGATVMSDGAVIGVVFSTGNVATVTGSVSGDDTSPSTWTVDGVLAVGKEGAGQLDVLAGGRVHCDTLRIATATQGAATVLVDGSTADGTPPSTLKSDFLIDVGAVGEGTLEVKHGGFVDAFSVGVGVDGPGALAIEGTRLDPNDPAGVPSFLFASTDATVGAGAIGTVDVRENGQLGTPLLVIGSQAIGVVTVDAATLTSSQLIRVGGGSIGTLELANGSTGLVHAIDLGAQTTGAGFLIVTGESPLSDPAAGSPSEILAHGDVRVGVLGEGELTVKDGGALTIKAPARLDVTAAGGASVADRGHVTVTGRGTHASRIDVEAEMRIGGGGQVEALAGGRLTIGGAALLGGGGAGVLNASGLDATSATPATIAVGANLVVGTNGDGVVSVTSGGTLTVGGTLTGALDLRPGRDIVVKIDATLAKPADLVTWQFTSLDPTTLTAVTDPDAGFLPPNTDPPHGDGAVSFFVEAKAGLPTGTEIENSASIVFDFNAPIATPEWLNSIDATEPVSQVDAVDGAGCTATDLTVRWSGTDQGGGIASYSVYVSEDGGPVTPLVVDSTATSAPFVGQLGKSYAFYSVARDLAGNVETVPATPDVVRVIADCSTNDLAITKISAPKKLTLTAKKPSRPLAVKVRVQNPQPARRDDHGCEHLREARASQRPLAQRLPRPADRAQHGEAAEEVSGDAEVEGGVGDPVPRHVRVRERRRQRRRTRGFLGERAGGSCSARERRRPSARRRLPAHRPRRGRGRSVPERQDRRQGLRNEETRQDARRADPGRCPGEVAVEKPLRASRPSL
ncbi:MAG: hypothetical protein ABIR79_17015 [Candidatus Binatia bacterium]